MNASLARRRTAMPAPEADRAALEDKIGFEADNAAMTQVDHHTLWQPIFPRCCALQPPIFKSEYDRELCGT